jgi:hypothetical protein
MTDHLTAGQKTAFTGPVIAGDLFTLAIELKHDGASVTKDLMPSFADCSDIRQEVFGVRPTDNFDYPSFSVTVTNEDGTYVPGASDTILTSGTRQITDWHLEVTLSYDGAEVLFAQFNVVGVEIGDAGKRSTFVAVHPLYTHWQKVWNKGEHRHEIAYSGVTRAWSF